MTQNSSLKAGDIVRIRSLEDILGTLDDHGELERLPFMAEMVQYCGRTIPVAGRAHKTCDSVNKTGARRMFNTVHLEGLRCSGKFHGNCQAGCLLFWKEQWIEPVREVQGSGTETDICGDNPAAPEYLEKVARKTDENGNPVYSCQATRLPSATCPMQKHEIRGYVEDFTSGNTSLGRILASLSLVIYLKIMNLGIGLGKPMRWGYDLFKKTVGGVPYPYRSGLLKIGAKTPSQKLDLKPGERVRVKKLPEILATLDKSRRNRGLLFNEEMVYYCGGEFRVRSRVNKIINESTGRMMHFQNECIILEGVECEARYVQKQLFCPRKTFHYWREIWLERI